MTLADVNILLSAFRPDAAEHAICRAWLLEILGREIVFGVSPHVLASVVRISTHPRIYAKPSPLDEAILFADTLLNAAQSRIVEPESRHWSIFCDLCRKTKASGNLIPDAWLAALAIEHDCEWVTNDGHFSRFPGLRWRRLTVENRLN